MIQLVAKVKRIVKHRDAILIAEYETTMLSLSRSIANLVDEQVKYDPTGYDSIISKYREVKLAASGDSGEAFKTGLEAYASELENRIPKVEMQNENNPGL